MASFCIGDTLSSEPLAFTGRKASVQGPVPCGRIKFHRYRHRHRHRHSARNRDRDRDRDRDRECLGEIWLLQFPVGMLKRRGSAMSLWTGNEVTTSAHKWQLLSWKMWQWAHKKKRLLLLLLSLFFCLDQLSWLTIKVFFPGNAREHIYQTFIKS